MSDFEKRQIAIRFGKYHRFPVTFDNLNLSAIRFFSVERWFQIQKLIEIVHFHPYRACYRDGNIPAISAHRPDVMVFNGWVSTLEDDHRNRLRARTKPLRVPVDLAYALTPFKAFGFFGSVSF